MLPRSCRHLMKLLPVGAALLSACSADSGRDGLPRLLEGAGGAPALPAMPTAATPSDGAPTNGGSGNEGFPDFGDVDDVPAADTPITRTDCGSGPATRCAAPSTIRGQAPLYNVMVYVPSAELDPIVEGVSCDSCDTTASGRPVRPPSPIRAVPRDAECARRHQHPDGDPDGQMAPADRPARGALVPGERIHNRDQLRLPRDSSEGHLPRIAMTTGSADKLECLLRQIGVADTEFTTPEGGGRVNLYHETGTESLASGPTLPAATTLLGSTEALSSYDVIIMSCHGDSGYGRQQPTSEKEAMKAYLDRGGRAFGSHFYFSYLRSDDDNHCPRPSPTSACGTATRRTSIPSPRAFPRARPSPSGS